MLQYSIWIFFRICSFKFSSSFFYLLLRGNTTCTLHRWIITDIVIVLSLFPPFRSPLLDESLLTSEWVQATHTRNQKQQTTESRSRASQQRNCCWWSQQESGAQGWYDTTTTTTTTTTSFSSKSKKKFICRVSSSLSVQQPRSTTKHSNHDL